MMEKVQKHEDVIKTEENKRSKKISGGGGMSPILAQDMCRDFDITSAVNQTLVVENAFYSNIYKLSADKSSTKIPLFFDNRVIRADEKYIRNISDNHLKLVPYNCLEGVCTAAALMYKKSGFQMNKRVNYRFLAQSYFLYTSLCVGISKNGKIDLITSSTSVLNSIPVKWSNDKGRVEQWLRPNTDDLANGIVQCVQLESKLSGYKLKPAIINAAQSDYLILPKSWLDFLITYINNVLKCSVCKVSYYSKEGKMVTFTGSMSKIKGNNQYCFSRSYLMDSNEMYGVIRCVDVDNGRIEMFPITHFAHIERCK